MASEDTSNSEQLASNSEHLGSLSPRASAAAAGSRGQWAAWRLGYRQSSRPLVSTLDGRAGTVRVL